MGAAVAGVGASVQSLFAAGFIGLTVLEQWLAGTGSGAQMSEALASMASSSTPISIAETNGQPTVIEFYRPACKYCNKAASSGLAAVEEQAKKDGVNWVMLNTDEMGANKQIEQYVQNCGVYELPQFDFLTPDGKRTQPEAGGPVDIAKIARRV